MSDGAEGGAAANRADAGVGPGPSASPASAAAGPGEPALHRRWVDIQVFDAGDTLTVHSRLRDERPWHPDPNRVVLHDMSLELDVGLADMTITDARATMHSFPHEECPLIAPSFAKLVGVSVASGFTRALREAFGGVSGCSHLHELARATGPAVIQARIGRHVRQRHAAAPGASGATETGATTTPSDRPAAADPALNAVMLGTCHLWGEDGIGPRKIAAGWVPNPDEYPAPSLETIRARAAAEGPRETS